MLLLLAAVAYLLYHQFVTKARSDADSAKRAHEHLGTLLGLLSAADDAKRSFRGFERKAEPIGLSFDELGRAVF